MRYFLFFAFCLLVASGYAQPSSRKLTADANTVYTDENRKEISQAEFEQKLLSGLYQRKIDIDGNRIKAFRLEPSKTARGLEAPSFKATTLTGQSIDLSALRGKVVVINFWFTKCMPCVKEVPELNRLVEKYKTTDDVVFLAITHDNINVVTDFLKGTPFQYSHITDARTIENSYGISSFPTNVVIGKDGKFVFSQSGYSLQTPELIENSIDKALKSPDTSK